jgi:hypothetical protein
LNQIYGEKIASLNKSEVMEYDASDFVKDTFTKEDIKCVPIIVKHTEETVSKEDVERDFQKAGLEIKSFSSDRIGTGTKVETNHGTYTILIYGDVNGDGRVNVLDSQEIIKHIVHGGTYTLKGVKRLAANVYDPGKDDVNVLDTSKITKFILGKEPIIDTLPTSDIKNDHEKPVITLNGEKEVTINVSTNDIPVEYHDAGASVTDNVDYTAGKRLSITNNVDVTIPGDYEVIYNVTDLNGNKADEIKRIVHVVNYMTGISIETRGEKTDFAKGEEIKIDGMAVIAEMAYYDGIIRELPLDEVTITPKFADTNSDTISEEYVTIEYKGMKTTLSIMVTPHIPKFEVDGEFESKVGINEEYIAPKVIAKDDQTLEELNCEITLTKILPDGTKCEPEVCTENQIKDKIDTSVIGTKYILRYTAQNSLGNRNTLEKEIIVVDKISYVTLTADSKLKETNYLNGAIINLEGISAEVVWKSGDKLVVSHEELVAYSEGSDKANIAIFNPNNIGTNTSQTISIKYETRDPITGKNIDFEAGKLTINVSKRLETIVNENSNSVTGEIYEDVHVARVIQGAGEEEIDVSKVILDIKATPVEGSYVTDDLETKIWAENSVDESGRKVVDVFATVSEKSVYEITIRPYTSELSGYEPIGSLTPAISYLTSKITADPTAIELTNYKIYPSVSEEPAMYKTGDTLALDIIYKHLYENPRLKTRLIEVEPILYNDYNIDVSMEEWDGIGENAIKLGEFDSSQIKWEFLTKDGFTEEQTGKNRRIAKIKIKILEDLSSEEAVGVILRTDMRIYKKTNTAIGEFGNKREVTIFNSSKYALTFGEQDKTTAKLTMRSYSNNADYRVKLIDGSYYTMIPINLSDQYNSNIRLTNDMLSKPLEEGGIKITHHDINGIETQLVDIIRNNWK